jgi:hypothetical protein
MELHFGSGNAYGMVAGAGGLLVPRKFGALQAVSIDFVFNSKELYGQSQFPIMVARGQGKVTGKAQFAALNGGALNDIFFAGTNVAGQTLAVIGEAHPIPTTPFQVTVANAANFVDDLGVTNAITGAPMLRVASAPAAGQYSVAEGVYTFSTADQSAGVTVLIDYGYTASATGNTTTLANLLMGVAPTFQFVAPWAFNGKQAYIHLNACVSSQLTLATKLEDYVIPDFSFSAFADNANNIGKISLTE